MTSSTNDELSNNPVVSGVARSEMWDRGKDERKRSSAGKVITASPIQFAPRTMMLSIISTRYLRRQRLIHFRSGLGVGQPPHHGEDGARHLLHLLVIDFIRRVRQAVVVF